VAIVAGAGGALGHATTATLAASGLTAVAVDRNERGLRELPDSARTEVADTIDPAVATRLIDRIAGEVGPPDVLVNTIGALRPGGALTTTPEKLRLMIDGNLGTALWLSQAVAPHMQQQGSGVIVHVTARPGIEPSGMAAYAASRGAESRPRLPKAAGPRNDLAWARRSPQDLRASWTTPCRTLSRAERRLSLPRLREGLRRRGFCVVHMSPKRRPG
jgi:hypothetical protein